MANTVLAINGVHEWLREGNGSREEKDCGPVCNVVALNTAASELLDTPISKVSCGIRLRDVRIFSQEDKHERQKPLLEMREMLRSSDNGKNLGYTIKERKGITVMGGDRDMPIQEKWCKIMARAQDMRTESERWELRWTLRMEDQDAYYGDCETRMKQVLDRVKQRLQHIHLLIEAEPFRRRGILIARGTGAVSEETKDTLEAVILTSAANWDITLENAEERYSRITRGTGQGVEPLMEHSPNQPEAWRESANKWMGEAKPQVENMVKRLIQTKRLKRIGAIVRCGDQILTEREGNLPITPLIKDIEVKSEIHNMLSRRGLNVGALKNATIGSGTMQDDGDTRWIIWDVREEIDPGQLKWKSINNSLVDRWHKAKTSQEKGTPQDDEMWEWIYQNPAQDRWKWDKD